ncbi:SAM-dependent methyltransferase [Microbacterium sp. W1N]|uniref:SAM-dependent methyltransferase n=1 Tax=Microbacterium festucae TaxID=2977531 RepID=UPI0021BFAFB2|nr:SAM-dependent methyltransferase [Microbacterium festucae]MCT9820108.1 SAM-dependent methyltransferase [Microbacterium festucae]
MVWPFLYYPGDRLTASELSAARLDGDVVEVGEAFMPADAVETRELRAASLRSLLGDTLAATHESAAWVHGALPQPPLRHRGQRCGGRHTPYALDPRLSYRDVPVPPEDAELIGRVLVTSPVRTFTDLVRDLVDGRGDAEPAIAAMAAWDPHLAARGLATLRSGPPVHHKRRAVDYLTALTTR